MTQPSRRDRLLLHLRRLLFNRARRRHPGLDPRRWSNAELRRIAPCFKGEVVNVSGWRDEDKEGATYRSYFTNAAGYAVTNYVGSGASGDGLDGSLFLDLQAELPQRYRRAFDVALAHTVLEHVYDVSLAMRNIAAMTRDVAVVIVPFMQQEHYTAGLYGDFWRFTPLGIERLLGQNGLSLVHLASNDNPWYPIYILAVGARDPARWRSRFPALPEASARLGMTTYIYGGCVR